MNLLLTDVTSPSTAVHATDTRRDSAAEGFHSMMQKNLQKESNNDSQLIENEGVSNNNSSNVNAELSQEANLIPDFWVEHLAQAATQATTETNPHTALIAGLIEVEPSSITVKPNMSDGRLKGSSGIAGVTLAVNGEFLPVNGNPLPLSAEQYQLAAPLQDHRVNALQQSLDQQSFVQNMNAALNTRGVGSDTGQLETNSQQSNNDLLDQLPGKSADSSLLLQTSPDSSNARLHAAMSAINGLQNTMANPANSNPLASGSLLSNSLDKLVMTNPQSSTEWSNGIGERVSLMLNQKLDAATIRLDPPMLGKMDIQIQVRDDVTNVTINTQHAQTRDMVESASYRLKEFLQDAGYENVNVDVSHQSDQQKNDARFMSDSDRSQDDAIDSDESIDGNNPSLTAQFTQSNSLVDYFA